MKFPGIACTSLAKSSKKLAPRYKYFAAGANFINQS
jgi:hypothetical protein